MGRINRRDVLAAGGLMGAPVLGAAGHRSVTLVLDPETAPPVRVAAKALQAELNRAGYAVAAAERPGMGLNLVATVVAGGHRPAESFTLSRAGDTITASGADVRGLSYALWELARRVRTAPQTALAFATAFGDAPLNPVRSVMRQFTCEAYDKPWFYDRGMWPAYLAMLASSRFNRLDLTFGLAYDQLGKVRDSYFLFTYPFLLDVPGYHVRVSGLSDAERDRNLDTLRFISEACVAHGLDFQLGLWMHGYDWPAAPGVAMIEGLTPDRHATYCRDALALLLKKLPAVSSVGLRIHGESGVKEGSYDFWREVFDGVAGAGRRVEIDLHAKGVDETMIANALATGMPVNVSPKYWGEHFGLPYHQASIRDNEMPKPGQVGKGLMTLSEGSRSFTRYGYADLLREDRAYTVRHRIFPGTQHILACTVAPAYGAQFGFCGSTGADVMEPLTYRGRRGTASATPRDGYVARKMATPWDWRKYAAWYESFGRALYNPATVPAEDAALLQAGRLLPLVTTAYAPSAACDAYTPELYWNQPLAAEPNPNPYGDTAVPKVFDNARSFDPQLFSSMREHAAELLGEAGARVSPVQVATWLEDGAGATEAALDGLRSVDDARRTVDARLQARLGRFFAAKFRAGVLFAVHGRTRNRAALEACIAQYEAARGHWQAIVAMADGIYGDLSCSDTVSERGAWADKLPLIDADLAAVRAMLSGAKPGDDPRTMAAIRAVHAHQVYRAAELRHAPPPGFRPGEAVALAFGAPVEVTALTLWYRHVNQAERWQNVAAAADGATWRADIPAAYTASPWPLQYYAEVWAGPRDGRLYPGFAAWPDPQPYLVLRRSA
jgi:hypothetical protein